jgi:hypothetical protein
MNNSFMTDRKKPIIAPMARSNLRASGAGKQERTNNGNPEQVTLLSST